VGKKHISKIINVRSYRGPDNDTDHYLVMIKLRIRQSTKWKQINKSVKAHYNTEKFAEEEKRNQYQDLVYQTLEGTPTENEVSDETLNVERMWKKLKNVIQEAADKIMGPIKHTKGKALFDGECKNAIESRNKASLTMLVWKI